MIVAFACIRTLIMCKCSKIGFSPEAARNVKSQQGVWELISGWFLMEVMQFYR